MSANETLDYEKLKEGNERDLNEWKTLFLTSVIFAVPIVIINMIIPLISNDLKVALEEHIVPRVTYKTLFFVYFVHACSILYWISVPPCSHKRNKTRQLGHGFFGFLGTNASYFYSVFSVFLACMYKEFHGQHFFESSALLLTFVVMGKLMESYAKGRTSEALSKLLKLQPRSALIIEGCSIVRVPDDSGNEGRLGASGTDSVRVVGGQEKMVDIDLLQCNDIAKVLPGSTIPADGVVIKGQSTVDESMMTGESMPVGKSVGMIVYGSTINHAGTLYVRISRVGNDTALAQIVRVVQEAQTSKAPIEKIADKVSGIFAPVVLLLSVMTFFGWLIVLSLDLAPQAWVSCRNRHGRFQQFCFFIFVCNSGIGDCMPVRIGSSHTDCCNGWLRCRRFQWHFN